MPEVNLTPLIDTALTLLIIFMVTTPMIQNAIKVDLPKGSAKEAGDVKQELVVYIDKQGQLFFNGSAITQDQLMKELQKVVSSNQAQGVFVKADTGVQYGAVLEIVDQIKVVGGVQYVALATQKRTG
jgi:biopolymer transport protein ExbD